MRRFVAARRRGDAAGEEDAWLALLEQEHDRMKGYVALFAPKFALSADEREEAMSLAMRKAWQRLRSSFQGSSMGELVLALKACCRYACMQVQREAAQLTGRSAPLAVADEEGEERPLDEVLEQLAEQHRRREEQGEAADFVAWAIPRIPDPRMRRVQELDRQGLASAEIAELLGESAGNVYQLRRRGLNAMAELKEQWDA